MMRRLWLLLLFASITPSTPAAADERSAVPSLAIAVIENPESDSWSVTYRFAEPVTGLIFQRKRTPSRRKRWKLLGPELSWGSEDDWDVILVDNPPVRELALEFASDFRPLVKQYELNLSYTDSSRLLYTGQLSVRPLGAEKPPDHRWQFRTVEGRNVVVLDRYGEGALEWLEPADSTSNGTYAYFGPQRPEPRKRMSYLIDPGLPPWMRTQVETLLPRLFDRYAEITGVELDFRPLVLLSYRQSDASGLTFLGGTLDGLVQIAAEGRAWERETPDAAFLWLERTAHEIFHFWTGEMFVAALQGDEEWLTEGAADHFALAMAVELGLLDNETRWHRLVERANDCLVGLAGRPLLGSTQRNDFRRLYTCGSTLWLWASAAAQSASETADRHSFVRALLAEADEEDRELTTYRFLETLHRLTGSPWAGAPLARLLFVGIPAAADELFAAQFRAAGLEIDLVPPAGATLSPGLRLPDRPDGSWSRLLRVREDGS